MSEVTYRVAVEKDFPTLMEMYSRTTLVRQRTILVRVRRHDKTTASRGECTQRDSKEKAFAFGA